MSSDSEEARKIEMKKNLERFMPNPKLREAALRRIRESQRPRPAKGDPDRMFVISHIIAAMTRYKDPSNTKHTDLIADIRETYPDQCKQIPKPKLRELGVLVEGEDGDTGSNDGRPPWCCPSSLVMKYLTDHHLIKM